MHQCIDPSCKSYSIFIGPEGGFAEKEVQLALDSGVKKATLGPRILRTETAASCCFSCNHADNRQYDIIYQEVFL